MSPTVRETRHQRALSEEFDLKGGYVAPELEGSIQPTVLVADLTNRDVDPQTVERRNSFGTSVAASAANRSAIAVRPSSGSNLTVLVTRVQFTSSSGLTLLRAGWTINAFGAPTVLTHGDFPHTQIPGPPGTTFQVANQPGSIFLPGEWLMADNLRGGVLWELNPRVVLALPNTQGATGQAAFVVETVTLNADVSAIFEWVERRAL